MKFAGQGMPRTGLTMPALSAIMIENRRDLRRIQVFNVSRAKSHEDSQRAIVSVNRPIARPNQGIHAD
jgi:hypothetical protein